MRACMTDSPSLNLRRYGQYQFGLQLLLGAVGFVYCLAASLMDGPVMDSRIYGTAITNIPAEYWSWPIFISSCVYILGIYINGNWRWSPGLRLFGALFHASTLLLFSVMGYRQEFVDPFVISSAFAGGANVVFVCWNFADLLRAAKGKEHGRK